jgi:hypothetical protein
MNTRTAATTTAARLLGLRFNDAARNCRPLPEEAATHFWNPVRGGGAVIVGVDGTYLHANSPTTWEQLVSAYTSGRRTTEA